MHIRLYNSQLVYSYLHDIVNTRHSSCNVIVIFNDCHTARSGQRESNIYWTTTDTQVSLPQENNHYEKEDNIIEENCKENKRCMMTAGNRNRSRQV